MRNFIKTAALAAMLLAPGAAQAAVFDAAADFSLASNPNSPWSYGYSTTLGGAFNLYDAVFAVNSPTNNSWGKAGEPFLLAGKTVGAYLHPGNDGEVSIFRFTAPAVDTYSLSVQFLDADSATTDVHVRRNNISLFTGAITDDTSINFTATLNLAANEIIDFAAGFGSNGNHFFDSTSLVATLRTPDNNSTAVPEPMTLSLLGAGLLGLGAMRHRRR